MKLICDVPQEIYELIINDKSELKGFANIVKNGIPLKQVRAKMFSLIDKGEKTPDYTNGVMNCLDMIDSETINENSLKSEDDNTRPYYANEW